MNPARTTTEMKDFVRQHFDDFVNRRKLEVADVNFSADFVDPGADVPPGMPPGPQGAKQYVGAALERFPDMHVTIETSSRRGTGSWSGTPGPAQTVRVASASASPES